MRRSVRFFGCRARRNDAKWCDRVGEGEMPSAGGLYPAAGCGRHETRSRHPLRCPIPASPGPLVQCPSCNAPEAPRSKELQRCHASPKLCYLPCRTHPKGDGYIAQNIFIYHGYNLMNEERSTAGYRLNPQSACGYTFVTTTTTAATGIMTPADLLLLESRN